MRFEDEVREMLEAGLVLVGRIGYRDGFELRARADGAIERIDHDAFLQLVVSHDVREVIVRIEEPGRAGPRVVVLARDDDAHGVAIEVGPLYVGGRLRLLERIDDAGLAEARWSASALPSCWVSHPAPGCC